MPGTIIILDFDKRDEKWEHTLVVPSGLANQSGSTVPSFAISIHGVPFARPDTLRQAASCD